jgi:hypothetical protein
MRGFCTCGLDHETYFFMYPYSYRFMREVYIQYRCILMSINKESFYAKDPPPRREQLYFTRVAMKIQRLVRGDQKVSTHAKIF